MKSKDQIRLEESYQQIVEASMMKAISDEAIQRVVDRLNQIDQAYNKGQEFKGKLTVDRVKSDERVKNMIFSPENIRLGILRGDDYVSELWNSDRFVDLAELLGFENQ